MIGALRSELRKFFTTGFWWMMWLATVGMAAAFSALLAFFTTMPPPEGMTEVAATPLAQAREVYGGPIQFGYLLSLVAGVLTMGSELRHRTIASTFLATPNRLVVMGAKIAAQLVTGLLLGVGYVVGALIGGGTVLAVRGEQVFPEPRELLLTLVMAALVVALWSLIGLGLGILLPMVAAIITGMAVGFIVEPLLGALLASQSWGEPISRVLPGSASLAMMQFGDEVTQQPGMPELLQWWQGALVLGAWGLLFALLGSALVMRRDVS